MARSLLNRAAAEEIPNSLTGIPCGSTLQDNWPAKQLVMGGGKVDLRKLRYFARIVELGSISQAAADLYIAQPALSKSILTLEDGLRCKLLQRSPQGVVPTEAGVRLYEHCQIIFNQLERARMDVSEETHIPSGQVTLGLPYSVAAVLAVPLLKAATAQLPRVKLEIFQEPSSRLPDRILSGRIDIGLLAHPNVHANIREEILVGEDLCFVSAGQGGADGPIQLNEIVQYPLILPTRANKLRVFIESFFLANSLSINVVHEVDAIAHFLDCVEAGLGSTILPAGCVGQLARSRSLTVRVIDAERFRRTVSLACSEVRALSNAGNHVEALVKAAIGKVVGEGAWYGATLLQH